MKLLTQIFERSRFGQSPHKWIICLLGSAVLWTGAPVRAADTAREYQLKAAFLLNFTKFVEWPASSFQNPEDPIILGVLRRSPLRTELAKAVVNRKVGERELVVNTVTRIEEALHVHVLFIDEFEDGRMEEWLEALMAAPVLTVGESAEFEKHSGIITFVPENDKLRFNINEELAEKSRIRISSQLLKLAKAVNKK